MGDSLDMLLGEVKFSGIQTRTVEVEYTDHLTTSAALFVIIFHQLNFFNLFRETMGFELWISGIRRYHSPTCPLNC